MLFCFFSRFFFFSLLFFFFFAMFYFVACLCFFHDYFFSLLFFFVAVFFFRNVFCCLNRSTPVLRLPPLPRTHFCADKVRWVYTHIYRACNPQYILYTPEYYTSYGVNIIPGIYTSKYTRFPFGRSLPGVLLARGHTTLIEGTA